VAAYEYQRNVFKKSFILTLFSIPLLISFTFVIGLFMESRQDDQRSVGIVDIPGVLGKASLPTEIETRYQLNADKPLEFTLFETEATARQALEAHQIQAYFILPEHYPTTRHIEVVYLKEPGGNTWQKFYVYLRFNLLAGQPSQIQVRAAYGTDFIVRSIDGRRQVPAFSGPTFGLLMPLFIAMAFMFMLLLCSGYMLSALADEKENRTMEVLVTSVSPLQLVGGKVIGILAISLTLLLGWTILAGLGIWIAHQAGVSWFHDLSLDWRSVLALVTIAIPALGLAVALMTTVGVMVTASQEAQPAGAIMLALHLLPMYVIILFFKDPHSSLAVLLSLLPFTSLMTVGMRNLLTIVPAWQVLVSAAVQVVCTLGAVWLASRAFRLSMLRFGQRLNWRHLLRQA
jgi:ABC-2 type transport system permease protein